MRRLDRVMAALLCTGVAASWAAGAIAQTNSAAVQQAPNKAQPVPADLIIENARIYTPDGWASALAIARGTVVAVGDAATVAPHRTGATRLLDLKGKMVLPGMHDMHVHPIFAGIEQFRCGIAYDATPQQLFNTVQGCVAKAKPGEWISGRAYEAAAFGATPPHKTMLDKVAPSNPVAFEDVAQHSIWANSAALKIADITRDTPNPKGGIIERDAKGEPTGILRETATVLVQRHMPPPTPQQLAIALKWSLDLMASHGITAFVDADLSTARAAAYAAAADRGDLKQHVVGCMSEPDLIAQRMVYARSMFSPTCVKIFLDGVPTDSHTAAMVDNYASSPHGGNDTAREKGMLMLPQDELNAMVTRLDGMGLTVKFHAAGDAAVREGLNAIEAARKVNGYSGNFHDVGHNSFVQLDDIKRARSIGAAFEFSPYIWYPSPIITDIRKAVGAERMERWIPVKDALDAGALAVAGSDWPIVPNVNPWIAIETLVTREVPGGGGEALGAQERISLPQAIDMFTRAGARQMNMDAATGTIEAGKLADIIIIDRDIFAIPVSTIHETKVLRTFVGGVEIFTAPEAGSAR